MTKGKIICSTLDVSLLHHYHSIIRWLHSATNITHAVERPALIYDLCTGDTRKKIAIERSNGIRFKVQNTDPDLMRESSGDV